MAHAEVNVTSLRRAKIPQLGKLNKEMMLDALDEIEEGRDQEINPLNSKLPAPCRELLQHESSSKPLGT